MRRISIDSAGCEVLIERGLIPRSGELLRQALPEARKAAVLGDSNVMGLYGRAVSDALEGAGLNACSFAFAAGEEHKNVATYAQILDFLASERIERSDAVVALGGGAAGDMAGFAAATFLRGVPLVSIPTTLLSAADSSVGGKTAVNLSAGKNMAGCFYHPRLVICDPCSFSTLPESVYRDGCAEVIKYGVLFSREFFECLKRMGMSGLKGNEEDIIASCVAFKKSCVEGDERDLGDRRKLNLGHTFGHAAEKLSGFSLSHGGAVSIGMTLISGAAAARGLMAADEASEIEALLSSFGLPTRSPFEAKELAEAALSDKKAYGGRFHLAVPRAVGRCDIMAVEAEDLKGWAEGSAWTKECGRSR